MKNTNLISPWENFYKEIEVMFGQDEDIEIEIDRENYEVILKVNNPAKADALTCILPTEKEFGAISVKITVVPANGKTRYTEFFRQAFTGNPAFSYAESVDGLFDVGYVVFVKEVVQYHNDNTGDINGNVSTLYQEIAKDIFRDIPGIFYCTDTGVVSRKVIPIDQT